MTFQDVVLIFVSVSGKSEDRLLQQTYANKIYGREVNGQKCSAIQITTAASVCALLDLVREGALPQAGHVRQEQVQLRDFLANRFGSYYRQVPQEVH